MILILDSTKLTLKSLVGNLVPKSQKGVEGMKIEDNS